MRNYRSIASWSAAAKIRTKVIVCIQESENQGGVSLSPMSNPPAPTQRCVWRSWFSLRRKSRRVSQHPVGHPRDRSGIAGTLRTCFILRSTFVPRLCRRCRDCVLELLTLDYHHGATFVNRGRLDRLAAVRENLTDPEAVVELPAALACSFWSGEAPQFRWSPKQLTRESRPPPRNVHCTDAAMRLDLRDFASRHGAEPFFAHLPSGKGAVAVAVFWILRTRHPVRILRAACGGLTAEIQAVCAASR